MSCTDLGRVASHFYLKADSIVQFNEMFRNQMNEASIIDMMSKFGEFKNLQVRDDESSELTELWEDTVVLNESGVDEVKHTHKHVNINNTLTYIVYININTHTLTCKYKHKHTH